MELKPEFTIKQQQCGISFSVMHCIKVPDHKIWFCYMTCIVEFVVHIAYSQILLN